MPTLQTHRHRMRRYPMRKGGRRWHIAPERWREILAARDAERMTPNKDLRASKRPKTG